MARRVGSRALVVATTMTVSSWSFAAYAHEPWTYGFGSRPTAMGGAVAADVSDFSANYYNPAGITSEEGLRLGFGYFYADNNLRIDEKDSGVASSHGVQFGIAASGSFFGLPIGIGIATFVPDEGLSRITALRQEVPRWELYDNRSSVIYLAANLAVRPWDFLEVGGGLSFLAATRGRFEISGTALLANPYDSQLRHEVDVDLSSVRYPQVGMLLHLAKSASIGIVYRGETKLNLELDGTIDATLDAGIQVPIKYTLRAKTVQAFLPQQVVVGTSWRPLDTLKINADIAWVNWSAYENPTALTYAKLEAEVPDGLALELPGVLLPVKLTDPGFADRIVPRIGVEWYVPDIKDSDGAVLLRVPVRAGYFFERSPIPEQSEVTNFVDADRHTPSFGVGIEVAPVGVSLDLHGAVSILPERTTLKNDPDNLIGDYDQEGEMVNVGASMRGLFR
jgi:long-chain fatty acid transport protein